MHSFHSYICTAVTACLITLTAMPLSVQAQPRIIPVSSKEEIVSSISEETEISGNVSSLSVSNSDEERPEIIGDYKSGKWNGNTYINTWADYQITLPKGCQKESIASSSIQSHYDFLALVPKVGVSLRVAFNELKNQTFDSSITEEEFGTLLAEGQGNDTEISEFETVSYGKSLRVAFNELKNQTFDSSITEEEFGTLLAEGQGNDTEISEFETVSYGKREYTHFSITHQDQLIQDFYLRKVSHYMMVISFSHALVSELHAEDILGTLTYAGDLN